MCSSNNNYGNRLWGDDVFWWGRGNKKGSDFRDEEDSLEVQNIISDMDSVCGKYEDMVEFDIYLPDGFLEWDGNFAVPVFYVPPYDEYEIDSVYAYDAGEFNILSLL